jgi:uncharacterized membrane protein
MTSTPQKKRNSAMNALAMFSLIGAVALIALHIYLIQLQGGVAVINVVWLVICSAVILALIATGVIGRRKKR